MLTQEDMQLIMESRPGTHPAVRRLERWARYLDQIGDPQSALLLRTDIAKLEEMHAEFRYMHKEGLA